MRAPVLGFGLERRALGLWGSQGPSRVDGNGRCERIVLGRSENISGNSKGFAAHFGPRWRVAAAYSPSMLSTRSIPVAQRLRLPTCWLAWLWLSLSWSLATGVSLWPREALAQQPGSGVTETLSAELRLQVQDLAQAGAKAGMPAQARVEVQVGQLDPRLKLAPCAQVQPYLPTGLQMWGRTRIGLRCIDGRARWNVTLPVQVKVFARALVAAEPLASGVSLTQAQLAMAEIDIAAVAGAVFTDAAGLAGRSLARPVAAGEAISSSNLKARQWFAAGETVQVRVAGPGFAVAGEGQAMAAGLEGQTVKIRFENGRMVTGRVVGERRVEVLL